MRTQGQEVTCQKYIKSNSPHRINNEHKPIERNNLWRLYFGFEFIFGIYSYQNLFCMLINVSHRQKVDFLKTLRIDSE